MHLLSHFGLVGAVFDNTKLVPLQDFVGRVKSGIFSGQIRYLLFVLRSLHRQLLPFALATGKLGLFFGQPLLVRKALR